MVMSDATGQDRSELARRSLSRKSRRTTFTRDMPTKWHPTSLLHPDSGEPFTGDNCWTFVANAIEAGWPIEVITLRKPQGKRGFVMHIDGYDGVKIYVKLQLLADSVVGRSFHESQGRDDEEE